MSATLMRDESTPNAGELLERNANELMDAVEQHGFEFAYAGDSCAGEPILTTFEVAA